VSTTPSTHRYRAKTPDGRGSASVPGFACVVQANQWAPSLVRRRLRQWLEKLGWPRDEQDDLVLAVNEAVSNVAEHAYPPNRGGQATVLGERVDGVRRTHTRLVFTITDHGRWREPPAESERPRYGLPIMRAMTDVFRRETTSAGTRITVVSRPVRKRTQASAGPVSPTSRRRCT
jgi:serine/threonine-protein kinase RsbW